MIDALEAFYAPEFVNIRYDRSGQAINLPREVFMGIVRSWAVAGAADGGTYRDHRDLAVQRLRLGSHAARQGR